MKKTTDINTLKEISLFRDLTGKDIEDALTVLEAVERHYKKGAIILHAGSVTDRMGLVLKGSVTIENNDVWGNRSILSHVDKGGFFAETYALLTDEPMLVDVCANESCRILFLRTGILRGLLSSKKGWPVRLLSNLLTVSSHKNLALSKRSLHTSAKTIRERVMSYLNSLYVQNGTPVFDIPFDRQQLADYLNLERTALSKELGKMRADGLINCRKNHFELLFTDCEL